MAINIYSPREPHQDGKIIGTLESLKALKRTIELAINSSDGFGCLQNCLDSGGEEYQIFVHIIKEDDLSDLINPCRW